MKIYESGGEKIRDEETVLISTPPVIIETYQFNPSNHEHFSEVHGSFEGIWKLRENCQRSNQFL